MDKVIRIKEIHTRFKRYRGNMTNIWEEYSFLVHCVYNAQTEEFQQKGLLSPEVYNKTKLDAGGMKNRFKQGGNTKKHFIDAIGVFENYISSLVRIVYLDYPGKIGGGMSQQKLFELIIKSEDKQSMIDVLIEEKIRNIFYGNPVDIFETDKCKLEIGNIFKDQYEDAMLLYSEIVARRNVIIHNEGRVDKKYLKEISHSSLVEGQKIVITEEYLRGTIGLLIGISAVFTKEVIRNIYKGECAGKLAAAEQSFRMCYANDWYKNLMN